MNNFPLVSQGHTFTLIPKEGETLQECAERTEREMEALRDFVAASQKVELLGNVEGGSEDREAERGMKWIPIEERLPEVGEPNFYEVRASQTVLICYADGKISNACFRTQVIHRGRGVTEQEDTWEDECGFISISPEVVAWMPLPEPYKP